MDKDSDINFFSQDFMNLISSVQDYCAARDGICFKEDEDDDDEGDKYAISQLQLPG